MEENGVSVRITPPVGPVIDALSCKVMPGTGKRSSFGEVGGELYESADTDSQGDAQQSGDEADGNIDGRRQPAPVAQ